MTDLLGAILGAIGVIGFILVVVLCTGDDDDEMWGR